jgi:chemotaxis protein CheD
MSGLPVASNFYVDTTFHRKGVKLLPNEFFVTTEDLVLSTVLGSCVAACIHDRTAGIGGMNHFMLPDDGDPSRAASDAIRYGAYAMEVLLNELLKGGAKRERLEAKVFGGAAVLAGMTTLNIGDRNSEFVRRYLALEKVRITAEDLQGSHPRKVAFLPATGQVMVKKLRLQQELVNAADGASIAQREQALAQQLRERRAQRAGDVELFSKSGSSPYKDKPDLATRPRIEIFSRPKNNAAAPQAGVRANNRTVEEA